jgi:hypothetical protein
MTKKPMHPARKLHILAVNALLEKKAISLDFDGEDRPEIEEQGAIIADLAGKRSLVKWRNIGWGELEIKVVLGFDGGAGTPFHEASAGRSHTQVWLERKAAKQLQGDRADRPINTRFKREDEAWLKSLPDPVPAGFEVEGPLR